MCWGEASCRWPNAQTPLRWRQGSGPTSSRRRPRARTREGRLGIEPTHLFFDLDGTLTDPAPGITACLRHALEQLGEPQPNDELSQFIGPPLTATFSHLLRDPSSERIDLAIEHYRERFSKVGLFENSVFNGIPDALATLQGVGYELRVATSKPHVYADRIIDHFELRRFFPVVYGSELSGERSNKGALIEHALIQESVGSGQTWMIGDRRHDVEGAARNGVRSVGVLWGFGSRSELAAAGAEHILEEVDGLVPLFTG